MPKNVFKVDYDNRYSQCFVTSTQHMNNVHYLFDWRNYLMHESATKMMAIHIRAEFSYGFDCIWRVLLSTVLRCIVSWVSILDPQKMLGVLEPHNFLAIFRNAVVKSHLEEELCTFLYKSITVKKVISKKDISTCSKKICKTSSGGSLI
jgi:hypothetical protein